MKRKAVVFAAVVVVLAMAAAACAKKEDAPAPVTLPAEAPTMAPVAEPVAEAPAAAAEFSGADFADGNFEFLRLDHARQATSADFKLELATFDGQPAVKIAAQGKKLPWLGISVSTLLSDADIAKVDTVALKMGIQGLDGGFWPMTGLVYAYSGADLKESASNKVGVQMPDNNPKVVYAKLGAALEAGADNYVVFVPTQDEGSSYAGKNDIYILGVGFMDAGGAYLPVKTGAVAQFPAGFDAAEEDDGAVYSVALGEAPYKSDWNLWNSAEGSPVDLAAWKEAYALVVEYEDGPIDTNLDGWKFVVQVVGGGKNGEWEEITASDLRVTREAGQNLILSLENMKDVTEVQNVGLGIWDGAGTVKSITLLCKEGPKAYVLGAAPYKADWNLWNTGDGGAPLEIWNAATQLVVEYAPREDGESPIDSNVDGWKFVVQLVGGDRNGEWEEITATDLRVARTEGQKVVLTLEGMKNVTEVQNVGIGCWDGADTITSVYLMYKASPNKYDLGAAPYKADWNNWNSADVPLEAWQGAKALVVEYTPGAIDANPDGWKFVVQVVDGGDRNGNWEEITASDLRVERTEGQKIVLTLENMKDVTEVQNLGIGIWDGADTITRVYLLTSYSGN